MLISKAGTLDYLQESEGTFRVPPFLHFRVPDWARDRAGLLARIFQTFKAGDGPLVVRSSAANEDGETQSMAGAFESVLGVAVDEADIIAAIEHTVSSMPGDPEDEVIVQVMVRNIEISGVALTRGLDDGAPYIVINYDDQSGRSDTITSGEGVAKSVLVHVSAGEWQLQSPRLRRVLRVIRELESIFGQLPLDIEFALDTDGVVHVLQTRRISRAHTWDADVNGYVGRELETLKAFVAERSKPAPDIFGDGTVLANMTDWNPAEILGPLPGELAISIYRQIVTRAVWRDARRDMGYRPLASGELMTVLAGHPYIDVRASFNSFLPAGLSDATAGKLLDAELDRLRTVPELHDKVEFEIVPTVLTFTLDEDLEQWYGDRLTAEERAEIVTALRGLTQACLDVSDAGSLARAERRVRALDERQQQRIEKGWADGQDPLRAAHYLLDEVIKEGTRPFSVLARHGFIAESFLRSAVIGGALTLTRVQEFKRSIQTVAGELAVDSVALWSGQMTKDAFFARYGHLRPSAYDIQSMRYDQRKGLMDGADKPHPGKPTAFVPTDEESRALSALFAEVGLTVAAADFFDYAARAVAGREYGKFVFTRNLSDGLEALAAWGEDLGLTRDDLSHLPVEALWDCLFRSGDRKTAYGLKKRAAKAREVWRANRSLRMSYIIRDPNDLYVVPIQRSSANYITSGRVEASVVVLGPYTEPGEALDGKIVCIENADPGFDWLFSKNIAGLVTKYGGANSHMAIRCAEFDMPAAIGCGELVFNRVAKDGVMIDLDCAQRSLRTL